MNDDAPAGEHLWEQGWEGHTAAQRARLARLSLAEKLEWLEAAHEVVRQLAARRGRDPHDEGPTAP